MAANKDVQTSPQHTPGVRCPSPDLHLAPFPACSAGAQGLRPRADWQIPGRIVGRPGRHSNLISLEPKFEIDVGILAARPILLSNEHEICDAFH